MALLARETGNATKEHEDLAFAGGKGGARVAFHWFARFADHVLFADPPLGRVDDRTGRLAYNTTLTDLLESIAQVAHSPHSIIVLGSQIFDILKAPLGDYRANLALLIQHVIPHVCAPTPPSHERRASHCILVAGCVLHSLHVAFPFLSSLRSLHSLLPRAARAQERRAWLRACLAARLSRAMAAGA